MIVEWNTLSFLFYIFLGVYFYITTRYLCKTNIKKRWFFLVVILFSLFPVIISTFRFVNDQVGGTDANAYIEHFMLSTSFNEDIVSALTFKTKSSPAFDFLCFAIRNFTDDYHFFFFFIYSFIIVVQYLVCVEFFRNKTVFIPLVYLAYFFLQSFNIIRFMFGLSVLEIGLILLNRKKIVLAILLCFISSLIHSSLIVSIPLALSFVVFNIIKRHKEFFLVVFVVVTNIVLIVLKPYIVLFINDSIYEGYMSSSLNINANLTCILCAVSSLFFLKDFKQKKDFNYLMLFCVFFDFACLPGITYINFFRIHIIFAIPRLYIWGQEIEIVYKKLGDKKTRTVLLVSAMTTILFYTIFRFCRDWYGAGLMPYHFEWPGDYL